MSFFWEGFWVKDGKIINAKANKLINALRQENLVRLRSNWLPSPELIRTLENWQYMALLKERMKELKSAIRELGGSNKKQLPPQLKAYSKTKIT